MPKNGIDQELLLFAPPNKASLEFRLKINFPVFYPIDDRRNDGVFGAEMHEVLSLVGKTKVLDVRILIRFVIILALDGL